MTVARLHDVYSVRTCRINFSICQFIWNHDNRQQLACQLVTVHAEFLDILLFFRWRGGRQCLSRQHVILHVTVIHFDMCRTFTNWCWKIRPTKPRGQNLNRPGHPQSPTLMKLTWHSPWRQMAFFVPWSNAVTKREGVTNHLASSQIQPKRRLSNAKQRARQQWPARSQLTRRTLAVLAGYS